MGQERGMTTIIVHNDLTALRRLAPESVDLLLVIIPMLTGTAERLAKLAAEPAMREGGEVIIARSLPEAFAAL